MVDQHNSDSSSQKTPRYQTGKFEREHLGANREETANFSRVSRCANVGIGGYATTENKDESNTAYTPHTSRNALIYQHASDTSPTQHRTHRGSVAAIILGTVCLLAATGITGALMHQKANTHRPFGALGTQAVSGASIEDTGNEVTGAVEHERNALVDWDYWASENPDIVAWLVVPGTAINYPVAFAPWREEGFYLTHDASAKANIYGCLYISNACTDGVDSDNLCILGHNMSDGSMFAELLSYRDAAFLSEHRSFYVITPNKVTEYSVVRVYFDQSPLTIEQTVERTATLVTCANSYDGPERLIVSARAVSL